MGARRRYSPARTVGPVAAPAANAGLVARPPGFYGDAYSAFVGFTKFMLPIVAVVLVALVFFWPQLEKTRKSITNSIMTALTPEDFENLQIVRPRYVGVDDSNRPFLLTAEVARQESAKADLVTLIAPKADITLEGGTFLALTANAGSYLQSSKTLRLSGDVSIFHDEGYSFQTEEATIDFVAGTASGDTPVVAEGPLGTLNSEGFRVGDMGETFIFTGHARLVVYSDDEGLQNFMRSGGPSTAGAAAGAGAGAETQ